MARSFEELSERQQLLKKSFVDIHGYWIEQYDYWLQLDPDSFELFIELSGQPRQSDALDAETAELIMVALNASSTHLYRPGIRTHISNALDQGASVEEVLEVIQLVSVIGVHAVGVGVPALLEVTDRPEPKDDETESRMGKLRQAFTDERGYWAEIWDDILHLDPDYFESYFKFSVHPWRTGVLDPKVKEFVYIAIDVAPTHIYEPGILGHVANALDHGATREELMAVFELAAATGGQTQAEAIPVLIEEAEKRGRFSIE